MKVLNMIIFSLLLSSCLSWNRDNGAEKKLENFINARFSQELTKPQMLNYVAGEMATEIANMTDGEFAFFTKLEGFKKTNFKVRTKNCEEKKCIIVYTLNYDEHQEGDKKFSTEVKKVAEVVESTKGEWRIVKVDNIKTYLKSHEAIVIDK